MFARLRGRAASVGDGGHQLVGEAMLVAFGAAGVAGVLAAVGLGDSVADVFERCSDALRGVQTGP